MRIGFNKICKIKYFKQWHKLPESLKEEIIKYKYRFYYSKNIITAYYPKQLQIEIIRAYYLCG